MPGKGHRREQTVHRHIDVAAVAFAAIVTVIHLALYVTTTGSPVEGPRAWEGWWDQGRYLESATAFAEGDLAPERHWYALGYPLTGVPFVHLLPADPFFVVNVASVVIFALAFLAYFRPAIGAVPAIAIFLAAHLLPIGVDVPHHVRFPVWLQFIIPWSTTPVAALLMVGLLVVRGLRPDNPAWQDAPLGVVVAAIVAIRPSDVLALAPAGFFYIYQRAWRERDITKIGAAFASAATVLALYAALSWAIYGGLVTPYHRQVESIGASASDLHERLYSILIDASATHHEPDAALASMQPWLMVAIPLAIVWALVEPAGALVVGAAAVSLLSYATFNDFWPYSMLRLSLVHYIAWTLPVLAAAGAASATVIVRRRQWWGASVAVMAAAALTVVRPAANPLPAAHVSIDTQSSGYTRYELTLDPAMEVDAVDFVGATANDPRGLTMKPFTVVADGRPLVLLGDYRALQLDHGIRLCFTRHLEAARVLLVFDNTITNHPTDPAAVRPLRFTFAVLPSRDRAR